MAILTPTAAPMPSASLRTIVQRHPLVAYFFIACVGFWLAILPLLLGRDGLGLFPYSFGDASILFAMLGTFTGPLLAAYLVTAATAGKAGVRALLRRYVQWRVGLLWYLVALFGCLLIWLAGYSVWLNGAPLVAFIAQPSLILGAYLAPFMPLLILAFGEETGWRGFALPRLQQQYGSLRATLVLAAMQWPVASAGLAGARVYIRKYHLAALHRGVDRDGHGRHVSVYLDLQPHGR